MSFVFSALGAIAAVVVVVVLFGWIIRWAIQGFILCVRVLGFVYDHVLAPAGRVVADFHHNRQIEKNRSVK